MDEILKKVKHIVEAAIMAAAHPLNIEQIAQLFEEPERPGNDQIRAAIQALQIDYADRAVELVEVASGYRFQVKTEFAKWAQRLWNEKPQRYSRAILETLAIIAYRQPITRAEIEDIRGVSVSTHIVKTLMEHNWIRIVGHRELPGKPALLATTKQFLDHFNLRTLEELPSLSELRNLEEIGRELQLQLDLQPAQITEGEISVEGSSETINIEEINAQEDELESSEEDPQIITLSIHTETENEYEDEVSNDVDDEEEVAVH